jgi:hypothetical protein
MIFPMNHRPIKSKTTSAMVKYIYLWVPMVCIAIANGVVRQFGYGRYLSELRAHQLSSLIGVVLFGLYIWFSLSRARPATGSQALAIGFLWLGLTIAFEFSFGHFIAGHSWSRLFQDYNLVAGRFWVLVLIWITVAPYFFYRGLK